MGLTARMNASRSCAVSSRISFHPDGGHRIVLFFNVQFPLEDDRVLRGGPHLLLHTLRPRIERGPMHEDRT